MDRDRAISALLEWPMAHCEASGCNCQQWEILDDLSNCVTAQAVRALFSLSVFQNELTSVVDLSILDRFLKTVQ